MLTALEEELLYLQKLVCHVMTGDQLLSVPVFILCSFGDRTSKPRPLLLFLVCLNKPEIGLDLHVRVLKVFHGLFWKGTVSQCLGFSPAARVRKCAAAKQPFPHKTGLVMQGNSAANKVIWVETLP